MSGKKRLAIINPTCLEVLGNHRTWLDSLSVEILVPEHFQTITESELNHLLSKADGVILPSTLRTRPNECEMLMAKSLEVISIAASGYDWLDVDAATRAGIVVAYAPVQAGAEVVADLTWGLILAVARRIPHYDQQCRIGNHQRGMGVSVWGKTLGIVGLGNIGKAVARRAKGFDMPILAAEPFPEEKFVRENRIEIVPLEELLERSDFVSLHVRLNAETQAMIGAAELRRMKPTACLINAARQKLADERALTAAMLAGQIAGAAMDDPLEDADSPLLKLPNVITTPHLGNRAIEGVEAVFRCAVENVLTVFKGQRPPYVVNPEVYELPEAQKCFRSGPKP
jgi:D-3-phosphoglycerate dehydrogenase / 2-oxoglutarate reductase